MELLIFAHRGEAQEFIKHFSFRPLNGHNELYASGDQLLLITGEGIYEVFAKLGPVLGAHEIKRVVNLGIAGALDERINVGDFISARTVYCESEELHFHSYTSNDEDASLDVITSSNRVLDDGHASRLSNFAPLVDRELWAIAKLCAQTFTPFFSYKLVSDMAGGSTACFDLKQKAMEFSTALLEGYLKTSRLAEVEMKRQDELNFPMSFSQKARFNKYRKALSTLEQFKVEELISELEKKQDWEKAGQKQKANLLLEAMELKLNPLKMAYQERFQKLSAPADEIGARILFDKNFEKRKFTIQMEINGQKNIENLKGALDSLDFASFEKVWDGQNV